MRARPGQKCSPATAQTPPRACPFWQHYRCEGRPLWRPPASAPASCVPAHPETGTNSLASPRLAQGPVLILSPIDFPFKGTACPCIMLGCCRTLQRAYEAWQCQLVGQEASEMRCACFTSRSGDPGLPRSWSCCQTLRGKTAPWMRCTDHAHRSAIQAWRTLGAAARLTCRFAQASPFWQPPLMWNLHTCRAMPLPSGA